MSEIVCWNLSWRARVLASPDKKKALDWVFFFLFLESVVVRTDGKNSTATLFFCPHDESDVVVCSNQLDAYRVAQ